MSSPDLEKLVSPSATADSFTPSPLHRNRRKSLLVGGLLGAAVFLSVCGAIKAADASPSPSPEAAVSSSADPKLPLKGKTIGITVIGTDHYWALRCYQAQIEEVKRLGGTSIALDAGRDDNRQISQIQTLISQKPDAIIEQLGTLTVFVPWVRRGGEARHT